MVERNGCLDHTKLALKVVLTLHDTNGFAERLVCAEFDKLCQLRSLPNIINVDASSLRKCCEEDGTVLGVGYLMETVGVPLTADQAKQPNIVQKLLKSLEALHTAGHYHGDSRLNNAVLVDGEIVWVDLVNASSAGFDDDMHKRHDLSTLVGSIFGVNKLEESFLKDLLTLYPSKVANVDSFVQYLNG